MPSINHTWCLVNTDGNFNFFGLTRVVDVESADTKVVEHEFHSDRS